MFHRLVSDSVDDGVLGTQTILGALRDLVILKYGGATCVEQATLRIGRPVGENNNDHPDHSRHDVRQLRLNVVVFSKVGHGRVTAAVDPADTEIAVNSVADAHSAGSIMIGTEIIEYTAIDAAANLFTGCTRGASGTTAQAHAVAARVLYSRTVPSTTLAGVREDVDFANARLAQSGIRIREPVPIELGPSNQGQALPGRLLDGFTPNPAFPTMTTPNEDEEAIIEFKDDIYNTLDVFYIEAIPHANAISYYDSYNATGDDIYSNWIVMSADTRVFSTLGHEALHILLNIPHRVDAFGDPLDPQTALFYPAARPDGVGSKRRIGPYPDAAAAGVGNDDTEVIRQATENLP